MADKHGLTRPPRAACELWAGRLEISNSCIRLREQELVPVAVVRSQHMHRPLVYETPERRLELRGGSDILARGDSQSPQHHLPDGLQSLLVEAAHQPIAHSVNAGSRIPV